MSILNLWVNLGLGQVKIKISINHNTHITKILSNVQFINYQNLVINNLIVQLAKGGSSGQEVDAATRAKAYRHLGWLYFCSERLSKLTLSTADEKQIELVAPLKQELRQQQQQQQQQSQLKKQLVPKQLNRKSLQLALEYLSKSAQLDSTQNATWYVKSISIYLSIL